MYYLGGFHLTKWMSNSRVVLQSIDEPESAKNVKDFTEFIADRVLDIHWNVETDTLEFQSYAQSCRSTRLNILSIVSSAFDSLGLTNPFVLRAKVILQEACRLGLNWKWSDHVVSIAKGIARISQSFCTSLLEAIIL